jgi:hypothetical protein
MRRMTKIANSFLPLLLFALSAPVRAQETQPQKNQNTVKTRAEEYEVTHPSRKETSALEKENLSRVAASPSQIKGVLVIEPGLLVALKRWIAQEASDNGQIVSDEDLTDNAVFDRLTSDVVFRSVATRLLQRFGYLLPTVNPDSPMGKQQDLLNQERVRRLVQLEAQEDAQAIPAPKEDTSKAKAAPCDPDEDIDCDQQYLNRRPSREISNPDQEIPQREMNPFTPNEGQPISSSPQILEAEASGMPLGGLSGGDTTFQSIASGSRQSGDSLSYGSTPFDPQMS